MNCNVIVSPLEAPGLDFIKKNDVRAAVSYFQGMNQKLNVDPSLTVSAANLFSLATASAPDSIKATLVFLRIKSNGKLLDMTKTFTEQNVKEGAFLKIEVLVN